MVDDRRSYRRAELLIGALHLADAIEPICRTNTFGLMLPTSGAFPIAALAGWFLGKTIVPLNYLLKPDDLRYVIEDCGTDTIITSQTLLDAIEARPEARNLVKLEDIDFTGFPTPRWPTPAEGDDLALLVYTSGTSGRPKGVMLTHGNISANIRQIQRHVQFTRRDVLLGVLPQFHSFGLTVLTLLPLTVGCRVVYSARFVPSRIVALIRRHRPSVFIGIPSMYGGLLRVKDARPEDFASLRYVVSGAEPLPASIFEAFRERFGITINEGYGLSETSPVTNWCRPGEWRPGSVGPPLPGVTERIVDPETARPVPPGRDGEVWIAGPNVMKGYFRLPEQTGRVFRDGFFRTGDIGRLDRDGHLHITGRLKEMLIVGGENVFPREIEEVLDANPSVAASGVVGRRDDVRGEVPVAFVELGDGATFDEGALIRWCRARLPGYKAPRRIVHVPRLPRGPTGKILRRELDG